MRFNQDPSSAGNLIRSYGVGEIKINDATFKDPVIVSSSAVEAGPPIAAADELAAAHAEAVLAHEPEVVLLGTGSRQRFPAPEFGAAFLRAGVGFEVMDTGAACRTFNVLVAEQRKVVALLIP
ncbi:MAG TPA: MTH938/NDUFAF3 family protein [Steroidobacteraceae bacterium]|nr:MTH938/NDUFAF3 family protein [Steroidobacteraceae bacterium]